MEENTILVKENLSDTVVKFVIYKPLIAKSAKAGQFVILRGREGGERVPVTLVDWDSEKGTITVIIQAIGKSTSMFNSLEQGEKFLNVAGPLGTPVEIKNYGTIELELDADIAPITVANFAKLVNEGFYDGLTFHRIIDGFMMQGGDPLGNGTGGSSETIKGEFPYGI